MTALCGGGASGPKLGVAKQILYSAGGAEALALFSGAEWFSPWAALIGQIAYNVTENCATDPPGYPNLTLDDFAASINYVDPIAMFAAIAKIRQWVETFLWYTNCQCISGSTPANPVPQRPPDLPQVTQPSGQPCGQTQLVTEFDAPGVPHIWGQINNLPNNPATGLLAIPPTLIYAVVTHSSDVPTGPTYTWNLKVYNPNSSTLRTTVTVTTSPGQSKTLSVPVVAGDAFASLEGTVNSGTGLNQYGGQIFVYCNGQTPGNTNPACCPADPTLLSMLNQILGQVTLIQRYKVPFAYVPGAIHSGIAGTGTLTVPNGLIGLRLELTTNPPGLGEDAANPNVIFGGGWWSVETTDSVVDERRVRYRDQFWFPPFMSTVTRVGYSLPLGAIARITELGAES
jgi:hypothetical protein